MNDRPALSDQAKVRCFGSSAALTVEATWLKRDGLDVATVNLDIAPRRMESVDWSRKITFQLSENELPVLAAVCLGYLPHCQFRRPDKGMSIERQDSKLFISASAAGDGNRFSLPIPIGQTFQVGCLLLAQLQRQVLLTDSALIIASLRGAAALYRSRPEQQD